MLAVRSVQEVIADAVTVKLPAHFARKRVEVIVLPLEEDDQGLSIFNVCFWPHPVV